MRFVKPLLPGNKSQKLIHLNIYFLPPLTNYSYSFTEATSDSLSMGLVRIWDTYWLVIQGLCIQAGTLIFCAPIPNFVINLAQWMTVIPLAKDIYFPWALWYGKCPRSLSWFFISLAAITYWPWTVWVITWLSATMCHLAKCPSEKMKIWYTLSVDEGTWPGAWQSLVQVPPSTWPSAWIGHSAK